MVLKMGKTQFEYDENKSQGSMKAKDIDKKFDNGEEVLEYFDTDNPVKPHQELKRVNALVKITMCYFISAMNE